MLLNMHCRRCLLSHSTSGSLHYLPAPLSAPAAALPALMPQDDVANQLRVEVQQWQSQVAALNAQLQVGVYGRLTCC